MFRSSSSRTNAGASASARLVTTSSSRASFRDGGRTSLRVTADVAGGRIVLSTPTANGAFAAYASAIDNVTNDPRTLLPR